MQGMDTMMQGTAGTMMSIGLRQKGKKYIKEGEKAIKEAEASRPDMNAEVDRLGKTRDELVSPLVGMYTQSYLGAMKAFGNQIGAVDEMLSESESMSKQGINSTQRQLMQEDITRSQAQYTQQASDLGAGLAGLGAAQGSALSQIRQMNAMDAQMRQQNQAAHIDRMGQGIGMKQNAQQLLMQERQGLGNAMTTAIQFDQSFAEALAIQEEWNTLAPWTREYQKAEEKLFKGYAMWDQSAQVLASTHGGGGGVASGQYGNNGGGNNEKRSSKMVEKGNDNNSTIDYQPNQSNKQSGFGGNSGQSIGQGFGGNGKGASNWGGYGDSI